MHLDSPSWSKGRAIIAVIAFYALSLQAFFAAATPAMSPELGGVICHDTGGPKHELPHQQHKCCTAACIQVLVTPAPSSVAVEGWPARQITKILWRPEPWAEATGPPRGSASARGPPVL